MASKRRLGTVASEVFAYGDIDTMVNSDAHQAMIAAHEAMERHAVREATERFVGKLRLKREGLSEQLAARARARAKAEADAQDRIAVVDRWREVGIRERMTIRGISRGAKWALWFLMAALDFYIFAQVMAYAENIADPGLSDPAFWLGGAVGLTVFVVGILLAQALRRGAYFHAQRKLLKELKESGEDTTGLRLSNYSRWMTLFFALFYVALTAGAVVLRYQGGGKEQPGLLMLTAMIPVIAVMLELLIDDPSEVWLPQRTIVDWWLNHRIRRLDAKIALRELIANERQAAVADRYRFESAALAVLHDGQGIPSKILAPTQDPEMSANPEHSAAPVDDVSGEVADVESDTTTMLETDPDLVVEAAAVPVGGGDEG